jgi:hypothetical protein
MYITLSTAFIPRLKTHGLSAVFHVKTVNAPDYVVRGRHGEHIAIRYIGITPYGAKYIIVPYDEGGEVRTAFITSDVDRILRREVLWRPP